MLVALWAALRRPLDARVVEALQQVDSRLAGIDEQISAAGPRREEPEARLEAIGSTIDLGDVLHRTLAAAEALRGSRRQPRQRPPSGRHDRDRRQRPRPRRHRARSRRAARRRALRLGGRVLGHRQRRTACGPRSSFPSARIRPDRSPSTRGSRMRSTHEAIGILRAIAKRAEPAVQNAFRYLEVQELAATDSRTGLGSALAFAGRTPAGDQRRPPARPSALPDPGRPRQLRRPQQASPLARGRRHRAGRVRQAGERDDPRQRRRLPELGRRGRVLPDPARDDARGGEASVSPARVRDRDAAASPASTLP